MKILELRFKNLNSLYGEWVIDFTDPEYVSNGIFALTGQTGVGKSTILDAICLALYGATPRLGKITKSGNEIMSRQTGECYAEVLFESQASRFRCHWEQRRARKKAEGKLQDQEHQISDGDTGRPIETMKSRVGGVIEEKTGMDFDRFTRSILLAQGGFDTFLKAEVEQKSKILEQLTGTKIYSEISKRVHERLQQERQTLEKLEAQRFSIVTLEEEEEKQIQQDLAAMKTEEAELAGKSAQTKKDITWLATIENLERDISNLTDEAAKLQEDIETFKPEQSKLNQAVKATSLEGKYATLTALREQQSNDQTTLRMEEARTPELETSANTQVDALKTAEKLTLKVKKDLDTAEPLIQRIRSLDQRIAANVKIVSRDSATCSREVAKIEIDKQNRVKEQENLTKAKKSLETAEKYIKGHAQDERLIRGLAGIEEQFKNLLTRQTKITQQEADLKNADTVRAETSKKLDTATEQFAASKQELESATKNLQGGQDTLNKLLGDRPLQEYRTERDNLLREMAYIQKINELEDHRARLESGKACPLCGSTEHPFAKGNVPVPDEIEEKIQLLDARITKVEKQEGVIKKLEDKETDVRNNLNDIEKRRINANNHHTTAEKDHANFQDGLAKLRTDFETFKSQISTRLQPLGITEIPDSEISTLLDSLKSRLNEWQEQVEKQSSIEKQVSTIDSEITRLNAMIEIQEEALTEKHENLEQLERDGTALSDKRKSLYGNKQPDEEAGYLKNAIKEAEESEKNARSLNTKLQQKLNTARTRVQSLKNNIEQRNLDLNNAEESFAATLVPVGFADEKQFCEARLTDEERESLSARANKLAHGRINLQARQEDREVRLAAEKARKVTEKNLEELRPQCEEYEESLRQLQNGIAAHQHSLAQNTQARKTINDKLSAIDAQKKECHRWESLHVLIGSADGKKYRNFAQGLTFELMVSHANQQLEKMTDRYLLARDEQQPLELNVVDNYQAGEIRSTKNLSGGESFIVSLTLALGLSKMASQKVRVDSLFIDEGFGTLDEEALETALEALSGLQQGGKLIGIISHVPALKERISTQIDITPDSGGRSSLSGPGCARKGG